MSLAGIVDDLISLQRLVDQEGDSVRRAALDAVRSHVAERDRGAKVTEAASVLGVSPPTVRAWIESGALRVVANSRPVRVDVMSLAATKQVVDELRRHRDDPHLLADVLRVLRDRAVRAGDDSVAGIEDVAAGRARSIDQAALDELLSPTRSKRSTSA